MPRARARDGLESSTARRMLIARSMKHALLAFVIAALAGPAHADPARRGPDFVPSVPPPEADIPLVASSGTNVIAPSDEVMFAPGSCALDSTGAAALDDIASWLAAHPRFALAIEGHGGASATADGPVLAARRAENVRAYLARRGVASDRVVVIVAANPRSVVEVFASDRPPAEIARASIAERGALATRWTDHGAQFEEEPGMGTAIATRR